MCSGSRSWDYNILFPQTEAQYSGLFNFCLGVCNKQGKFSQAFMYEVETVSLQLILQESSRRVVARMNRWKNIIPSARKQLFPVKIRKMNDGEYPKLSQISPSHVCSRVLVVVENDKVSLIKVHWNGFLIIKLGGDDVLEVGRVCLCVMPNYRLHLSHLRWRYWLLL